jgi:hypothetical protein
MYVKRITIIFDLESGQFRRAPAPEPTPQEPDLERSRWQWAGRSAVAALPYLIRQLLS